MSVPKGKFKLYQRAAPALRPAAYTVKASQKVTSAAEGTLLQAKEASWTLTVQAPRLILPPHEILGCFPAPDSRDANVQQLPHVLLRQRTMPWARRGPGDDDARPWMALLLFRKDEVSLTTDGSPIASGTVKEFAQAMGKQPHQVFEGLVEELYVTDNAANRAKLAAEPMMWATARRSVVRAVRPRLDTELPLLAHVREVNRADEDGKGDEDGFVSVVLGNRLPGDPDQDWVACLVNLELFGKDHAIWKDEPVAPVAVTPVTPVLVEIAKLPGMLAASGLDVGDLARETGRIELPEAAVRRSATVTRRAPTVSAAVASALENFRITGAERVRATDLVDWNILWEYLKDPLVRLPVLAFWRFRTAEGVNDFEAMIKAIGTRPRSGDEREGLGLLGADPDPRDLPGGHLRVEHVSREGNPGHSYFRGPLTSAPIAASAFPADPATLVTADQLVTIIAEDEREDVSLAAAWEVGRLLALSRKDVLQTLVDWQRLARQKRVKLMLGKQLAPFRIDPLRAERLHPYGLLEELGLLGRVRIVKDLVVDPVLDPVRIDPLGLDALTDMPVAAPGLNAGQVQVRTGLSLTSAIYAELGEGPLGGLGDIPIRDAGGLVDLTPVLASGDLGQLDQLLPELLELVTIDPSRGVP